MTSSPPAPTPARNLVTPLTWVQRGAAALGILALLWALDTFFSARINAFYYEEWILMAGVAAILAASLNLINGVTGQFSLGHAGFMAVGAYSSALFSKLVGPQLVFSDSVVFGISILIGALAAALAGFLVGLPSLRLRGDYLAIATLGFGQIIVSVAQNLNIIGGATGLIGIPKWTNGVWVGALLVLCILSLRNIGKSQLGREMRAIRDDEIAAEAAGINTTRVKVIAFVFSALWAGVAGALQAHLHQIAHPTDFGFVRSIEIVVMVVVGGLGSLTGSVCAAVLLTFLNQILRDVSGATYVSFGVIALAAFLSFDKYKQRPEKPKLWVAQWLCWPVLSALGVALMLIFGADLVQKYIGALRTVIYSIILIVMMLLRPQGLLGRAEWSWKRRSK
ncbi:amino acid/amide ABC transporter membrane protein 2, HAAT family [Abditibacterium utsteinense]|uniref:Amino acid/amide ABC transporter membrane protein 2, HAAT family n=1 Tax=Abditibacterium utsteinense TaxID=1960156 RepID=A0A2S8SVR5_9BACT|nr:branched-chain amino acid ABC transporter permease [Abditibacterium utsteinense]PQV64874.1 amino acid/amide ABC transporter membrane protein 2, HAAT family [Abditibacterium utsteinense]